MWSNPQFSADLVTFAGDILTGKLHFLCSVTENIWQGSRYESDIWAYKQTYVMLNGP